MNQSHNHPSPRPISSPAAGRGLGDGHSAIRANRRPRGEGGGEYFGKIPWQHNRFCHRGTLRARFSPGLVLFSPTR